MQKHHGIVQDTSGNAVSGATVTITVTATGLNASLFEDNESTPKSNPITTGSDGRYEFKAADGAYTHTAVKGSVTVTLTNVQSFDGATLSANFTAHAAATGTSVHGLGSASLLDASDVRLVTDPTPNRVRHLLGVLRTR